MMFPTPDLAAARALGDALHGNGYDEAAIDELLGEDAYTAVLDDVLSLERRLPDEPLASVVRAFFLELPVPVVELERALGRAALDALAATRLAEVGDAVVPRTRIAPVGDLLVASDVLSTDPSNDPPDYVATYTPTSRLCDFLTPRPLVERALDVGTGNGIHAILAARHAEHVVATDVNERALVFTAINAALNGMTNIECRHGSMFEPAGNERFGLITCNAPFVISPERRWTYRDGLLEGDELSEQIVLGAAERLTEGGFATLLVSWLGRSEDAADEHVLDWTARAGCDAWVLALDEDTPLDHAARWNAHLSDDPAAYAETLDRWTSYVAGHGAGWVTEGAVLLHRGSGSPTVRVDEVDPEELEVADAQIRRAFAARAQLASIGGADLAERRFTVVPSLRAQIELAPGRAPTASLHLDEGTHPVLDAPPRAAEAVIALDGGGRIDRANAVLARELLELGALEFADED
ncbi:MAG: methyltransferase [Gaiellaceae bacterium]